MLQIMLNEAISTLYLKYFVIRYEDVPYFENGNNVQIVFSLYSNNDCSYVSVNTHDTYFSIYYFSNLFCFK